MYKTQDDNEKANVRLIANIISHLTQDFTVSFKSKVNKTQFLRLNQAYL